jgi:uncharacterized repeat protein (TIGR03803 family)
MTSSVPRPGGAWSTASPRTPSATFLLAYCLLALQPLPAAADGAVERTLQSYVAGNTVVACFDCAVGPIAGSDGTLYGTTPAGGAFGGGTLYRFDAVTGYKVLAEFGAGTDPRQPSSYLVAGTDGNLYGSSEYGGKYGRGTVYRVNREGKLTVIQDFPPHTLPNSLMQASDGNLYGTTIRGGNHDVGTIFRIAPDGTSEIVFSFPGFPSIHPVSALVETADGWLYGTALGGSNGTGALYRVHPSLGKFQVVHDFGPDGSGDGSRPLGRLTAGHDGVLYGVTENGGPKQMGTIYRLEPDGRLKILHSFEGDDGMYPFHTVSQDADGNLFGTTEYGGAFGSGTAWRLSAAGEFSNLFSFGAEQGDGWAPSDMTLAPDGSFYGLTTFGGRFDGGTFFVLTLQ